MAVKIRHREDGTYWLPRPDVEQEKKLDAEKLRKFPRSYAHLEWVDHPRWPAEYSIDVYRDAFSTDIGMGHATVFGKGPSLDDFDFSLCHGLRICLNETVRIVPEPDFCVFNDQRVGQVLEDLPPSCTVVVPPASRNYPEGFSGLKLLWDWERHSRSEYATAASALWVLGYWGIRRVWLVGFDSLVDEMQTGDPGESPKYSAAMEEFGVDAHPKCTYGPINRQVRRAISDAGMQACAWSASGGWLPVPASDSDT